MARDTDASDHGINPIPVAFGVGESLQHERRGPFAGNSHLTRQHASRVARQIDPTDERAVEFPGLERTHTEFERPRRGTFLTTDRVARSAEVERPRNPARRDAAKRAHRAVRAERRTGRVGFRAGSETTPPQMEVRRVRVEAKADEHAGCGIRLGGLTPPDHRIVERRGGDLQHQQLLWERVFQFLRRDAEPVDRDVQLLNPERGWRWFTNQPPAVHFGRRFRDRAIEHVLLELPRVVPAPEVRRQPDDCDWRR